MRRSGLLGVAVLGLAVGGGCRTSCNDRCGAVVGRADLASRIGGRGPDRTACGPAGLASIGRPVSVSPDDLPPAGWMPDAGFGYPVYPGGEPIPVGPGVTSPPNELPYPNIPAPGVPESPAQPMPAIPGAVSRPGSSALTTGETPPPK
ncbi:MAG TPA: hypothetical protein VFG68_03655 [Fimbriiglobus sp.]|nr:hypothetical protein [Fimbriiglobus sp.]